MTLIQRESLTVAGVLLVGALLIVLRAQPGSSLARFDRPVWDAMQTRVLPPPPKDDQVTVVLVDGESLDRLETNWPMKRSIWGRFLDVVGSYQPGAVAIDAWFESAWPMDDVELAEEVTARLRFTPFGQSPDSAFVMAYLQEQAVQRNHDRSFAQALSRSGRALIGAYCPQRSADTLQTDSQLHQPFVLKAEDAPAPANRCETPQGNMAPFALASRGEVGVWVDADEDDVNRTYKFGFGTKQGTVAMLATAAAIVANPDRADELAARAAAWAASPPMLRFRKAEDYLVLRFSDVLETGEGAEGLKKALTGRAVLVGVSAVGTEDIRATPVERGEDSKPGVFIHANGYSALTQGFAFETGPTVQRTGLFAGLGLLALVTLVGLRFNTTTPILLVTTGGLLAWGGLVWWRMGAGEAFPATVAPLGVFAYGNTRLLYQFLRNLAARREAAETRKAFKHYLAPAVVEQLVENPDMLKLGGERKVITAFFSDVAGFTTISETLDPQELTELLNQCLGGMTEIILEEGGTIDKYIGDAIVAMFGAPIEQPDHAIRSIRAAVRCQKFLDEMRPVWLERGWPEILVRIGCNTGPATVGNMGSAQRFDYTMLGDTVNLAARLEGANKAFGTVILLGPKTAEMAKAEDPDLALRELDLLQVKGKTEGVRVWGYDEDAERRARSDEALALYRAQDWEGAVAAFEAMGDDPTAAIFLKRIEGLRKDPPGEGWDGVYRLTTK